jgi:hypothetical protein
MLRPWLEIATTEVSMLLKNLEESVPPSFMWYIKKQESKWEPWLYDMTAETCEDNDQNGLWNTLWNLVKPCETLWNLVKPCETFNMFNNDEVSNWFKLYEIWRVRHPAHSLLQLPMSHDMATPIFQAMPALPKRPSRKTGWPQLPRSISSACKMSSKCDMNDTAWLMTQRITANHSDAACRKRDTWRFARKTVAESAKFLLGSGAKAPCFAETAMYCNVLQYWSSSIQV